MSSLEKIKKIQETRKQAKKELYTKIYEQLSRKIVQAVEQNRKQVFLEVPGFVVGFPLFNRAKATEYIVRQLERNKFNLVKQLGGYEIYVSLDVSKNKSKKNKSEPKYTKLSDDEFPTLVNLKKTANNLR